jgi:uncharacterized HAD superfamily protein
VKIGVDIDGTIKQTHKSAVAVFNRRLKKNVQIEDVQEFYLDKAYGLTEKEGKKWWGKLEEEIYSLGIPLLNAAEALNQMKREGHNIFFITARPDTSKLHEITERWLTRYGFPFEGDNLFMGCFDKGKVANDLKVEIFFEDAPEHLERLVEADVRTVIVDAVYNRHIDSLPRIRTWDEGLKLIREACGTTEK